MVDHVQRLVRPAKVGHAGTLDPLATGVLVVCVGGATRLIEYVQAQAKVYEARFLLGQSSPTEDVDGEITLLENPTRPTREQIENVLPEFTGAIMQVPPQFSALKVQGRRAYDLARAGKTADLQPRPVTIHALQIVGYEYPELQLSIECGSGTYVRSLGRDIARRLGTEAVMASLERTRIGCFDLATATRVEAITSETIESLLLPPRLAVADLPSLTLTVQEAVNLRNGLRLERPGHDWAMDEQLAAFDQAGELVGVVQVQGDRSLKTVMNLPTSQGG
jgi:tRNA pseudouridine55 synthase